MAQAGRWPSSPSCRGWSCSPRWCSLVALFFAVVFATAGPTLAQQIAQLARGIAAGATTLTKELASFADQANLLQNVDLVQMLSGFLSPWGIATGATSVALSIVGLFSAG